MSRYDSRIWPQELCLDIGDSPTTAEAVRHPRAWFENSWTSPGIFYAPGNMTITVINLGDLDDKYLGQRKKKGFFSFCFLFKYNINDLLNLTNYQVNIYKEAK